MIRRLLVRVLLASPDARRELLRGLAPTPDEQVSARAHGVQVMTRALQDVAGQTGSRRQGAA